MKLGQNRYPKDEKEHYQSLNLAREDNVVMPTSNIYVKCFIS